MHGKPSERAAEQRDGPGTLTCPVPPTGRIGLRRSSTQTGQMWTIRLGDRTLRTWSWSTGRGQARPAVRSPARWALKVLQNQVKADMQSRGSISVLLSSAACQAYKAVAGGPVPDDKFSYHRHPRGQGSGRLVMRPYCLCRAAAAVPTHP